MPDSGKNQPSASDLKALVAASKTLNNLTDSFSEQVENIEQVLNSLNLGLRVSVIVNATVDEDNPSWSHTTRLLFDKEEGEWGLVIDDYDEYDGGGDEGTSNYKRWRFNNAPRPLRLQVVGQIPALIKALLKEAEIATKQVSDKLDEVKQLTATLLELGR